MISEISKIYTFIKERPEDSTRSGERHLWYWDNNTSQWNFVAVVNAEYRKTIYSPFLAVDNKGVVDRASFERFLGLKKSGQST